MYNEIPEIPGIDGWRKVKIEEVEESITRLSLLGVNQFHIEPVYFKKGIKEAVSDCYVRDTVVSMLLEAVTYLPKNYKLVIWDAWRPNALQEVLFEQVKNQVTLQHADWTEEEIMLHTQRFVTLPSYDRRKPTPHNTGGSVNVSLMDDKGHLLDMGTGYGEVNEKTKTRYYEQKQKEERLTKEEEVAWQNRRMLYEVMTRVGFTNYKEQWWHYDFGNQFWAICTGNKAIYSQIEK